jgi:hypothetical protein
MTPQDKTARDENPARVRGDIEKGLTGDKIEGFDPAAAPYETDSEAGGSPPARSPMVASGALRREPSPGGGHLSHGSAMRPFDDVASSRNGGVFWIAAIALLVAIAAVLAFVAS